MHLEILVEDQSGSIAIEIILEKILGKNDSEHSWRIHRYNGSGQIPRKLNPKSDPRKRILLDRLPRILRGYGRSLADHSAVVVVVDLDDRDCMEFKQELLAVLDDCDPRPRTLFRIAIEESEAWLLGDRTAVREAYPEAKVPVLDSYEQDSICGTWERLADAVHPGGSMRLKKSVWPEAGKAKCEWAGRIAPHMDPDRNRSKSFQVFRDGIRSLAGV